MHIVRTSTALALAAAAALAASATAPAAAAASTDPYAAQQWGPQQVRAQQAWATSTGRGAVIAVVDSGVDLSHPDLKNKLVRRDLRRRVLPQLRQRGLDRSGR